MRSIGGVARNTRIALRSGRIVRMSELRTTYGSCRRSEKPLFHAYEGPISHPAGARTVRRELIENPEYPLRQGILKLLAIQGFRCPYFDVGAMPRRGRQRPALGRSLLRSSCCFT